VSDLAERLRLICLALPEVTERPSHGAPTWFVRGKSSFVTLWPTAITTTSSRTCGARRHRGAAGAHRVRPERFFRPPYVGGRGWIGVRLDRDADGRDRRALQDAYRVIAPARLARQLDR